MESRELNDSIGRGEKSEEEKFEEELIKADFLLDEQKYLQKLNNGKSD